MQGPITFAIMPLKQTFTFHSMYKLKVIEVSNIPLWNTAVDITDIVP